MKGRGIPVFVALTVALFAVASTLSQVRFKPAEPWRVPEVPRQGPAELGSTVTTETSWVRIIGALLVVGIPMLLLGVFFSKSLRRQLARVTVPLFIVLLVIVFGQGGRGLRQPINTAGNQDGSANDAPVDGLSAPVRASSVLTWLLLLLGVVLMSYAAYRVLRREVPEARNISIAEAARRTASELRNSSSDEFADIVHRCYLDMGRAISRAHGVTRADSMTPGEFRVALQTLRVPQHSVNELTEVFERVRYSGRTPSDDEKLRAIRSLEAIAEACEPPGAANASFEEMTSERRESTRG